MRNRFSLSCVAAIEMFNILKRVPKKYRINPHFLGRGDVAKQTLNFICDKIQISDAHIDEVKRHAYTTFKIVFGLPGCD